MMKVLTLPKGAKEELNYGPEIVEKIINGEALWEEDNNKDRDSEINEDAEEDAQNNKGGLTEEQKSLMKIFGEGKYHLIPSFYRTMIFLKKQKREFSICFRTFGKDLKNVMWEYN